MPADDPLSPARPNLFGEAFPDLLDAARAGGGWALERLYDGFAGAIAGYVRTQGVEDPEATTNEVFLRAFGNLERFRGQEPGFRSWLFTIAHHAVIDERRRRSRRPVTAQAEVPEAGVPGADEDALDRLGARAVRLLLEGLSPDQRDVLVLRLLGDQTVDEVARIVGKRPGAVKALQRRGLATLRRRLEAEGVDAAGFGTDPGDPPGSDDE